MRQPCALESLPDDLTLTRIPPQSRHCCKLFLGDGKGGFTDNSQAAGVADNDAWWGHRMLSLDVDNDGGAISSAYQPPSASIIIVIIIIMITTTTTTTSLLY